MKNSELWIPNVDALFQLLIISLRLKLSTAHDGTNCLIKNLSIYEGHAGSSSFKN